MLRRLRVLAAFFMVPIVILGSSTPASAAWQQLEFSIGSSPIDAESIPGQIDSIDCTVNMNNLGGYSLQIGAGECYGLPDVTWGYTQDGESGSGYSITVSGQTETGSTCQGAMTSSLAQHSANGTLRVAGTITPGDMSYSQEDCTITEVCLALASGRSDCIAVTLEPPQDEEPLPSACPYGTPIFTNVRVDQFSVGTYNTSYVVNADFSKEGDSQTNPLGNRWTVNVWTKSVGSSTWQRSGRAVAPGTILLASGVSKPNGSGPPELEEFGTIAVQFSTPYNIDNAGLIWNNFGGTAQNPTAHSGATNAATVFPPGYSDAYGGWTDPAHCRFWYGPQIHSVEGLDGDTPVGPIEETSTDPDPEPDVEPPLPTQPVITEPDGEDEGNDWLGMIWAVLKSIWNTLVGGFNAVVGAVKGIASAILNGITGLLDAAFVPRDDWLETRYQPVHDEWMDTTPAKYLHSVMAFTPGSVSGCGGLPLNVTLPGDVAIEQNIGAACSGSMASAAGVVRAVLTAVFTVGGLMACLRGIGAGFGWNPGLGRGGDA